MEDYLDIYPDGTPKVHKVDSNDEEDEDEKAQVEAPFEPFKDMIKRKFLWYYETYLESVKEESQKVIKNQAFKSMPFEHGSNGMEGKFLYSELDTRLRHIRALLDKEAEGWITEGVEATKNDESIAVNLKRQFDQCVAHFQKEGVAVDIELEDSNPFHWRVVSPFNLYPNSINLIMADLLWQANVQSRRRPL
jgi:ubiquitin-conjugating enzyme E2 Z